MTSLGTHWVFDPFKYTFFYLHFSIKVLILNDFNIKTVNRFILTEEQVTLFIVHIGGLFIDLFAGYFLFFDKTRPFGVLITVSFHVMNSKMFNIGLFYFIIFILVFIVFYQFVFSIGMFPYTMLATTFIFFSNDWPKRLLTKLRILKNNLDSKGQFYVSKLSSHCLYDKRDIDNQQEDEKSKNKSNQSKKYSFYHRIFSIYTIAYISLQLFLPYSHFITKGYNNWTNGLYGYSWDMMVHSWHTQHIKINFIDKKTNKTHYLNPKAWTNRRRWSSHADMIYQYANCIKERLHSYNYTEIELYMDIWRSLNHRFHQRQIDPRVNMANAKWNPFEQTEWIIPLLSDLTDWRTKMKQIEDEYSDKNVNLTFLADLKGLKLENYVSKNLKSAIEVLDGQVKVEIKEKTENSSRKTNYTLNKGDKIQVLFGIIF